jgi:hypothetical protein
MKVGDLVRTTVGICKVGDLVRTTDKLTSQPSWIVLEIDSSCERCEDSEELCSAGQACTYCRPSALVCYIKTGWKGWEKMSGLEVISESR